LEYGFDLLKWLYELWETLNEVSIFSLFYNEANKVIDAANPN